MILKLNFLKKKHSPWLEAAQAIFRVSSITFMFLFGVEYFIPGFSTNWFNPIWLLVGAIVSGLLVVAQPE